MKKLLSTLINTVFCFQAVKVQKKVLQMDVIFTRRRVHQMKQLVIMPILCLPMLIGNGSVPERDGIQTADTYKVIKVTGQILYIISGRSMTQGDQFRADQELKFKTPDSKAAVISKISGRKILTAGSKLGKAVLLPTMSNPKSRSGPLNNIVDLQNHFKDKFVILEEIELSISSINFPMGDNSFFFMQYSYKEDTINKKLSFKENKLLISKDELLKVDGRAISGPDNPDMTLLYMKDANAKSIQRIGEFTPVFPNLEELKMEINVILEEYNEKNNNERIDEILSYLNQYYGKPHKENVSAWLAKTFSSY